MAYIAWAYGAGGLPTRTSRRSRCPTSSITFVAGGAASITFISIYTRFLAEKRDADAQKTFSIIITVMTAVMIVGTILTEIFAPQFVRWFVKDFSPDKIELCVHLTRILLPAQIFFYVGGVVSAVLLSHRLFLLPRVRTADIQRVHHSRRRAGRATFRNRLSGLWSADRQLRRPISGKCDWRGKHRHRIPPIVRHHESGLSRMGASCRCRCMLGVSLVTADDWILRHYASSGVGDITRLTFAKRLFAVPIAVLGQATGQASLPFFARLFNEKKLKEFAATVNDSVYRISAASFLATGWMMAAALPLIDLVYRRGNFFFRRRADQRGLLLLVLAVVNFMVGAGTLCARVLRRRRHPHAHGCRQLDYVAFLAHLLDLISHLRRNRSGMGIRRRHRH